jgi:cellulose synthase/poly-beta-1,6-N-acetylglucosamine synthase-like glycosyltransferase
MQCVPLTEDIDATIRALLAENARIISDPTMVSWELAPTTMHALALQRMRWSQGWSEVSARHLGAALRSPTMDPRQRLGSAFLLGWREAIPWVGLQIVPLVAYEAAWRPDHHGLRWALPIFMVLSMYTVGVNVVQSGLAWRLAVPELRARRSWFVRYLFTGIWYAEWKAGLARVCHLRHITGVAEWIVTPRVAPALHLIPRPADLGTAPE